jgi:hypothetical protein
LILFHFKIRQKSENIEFIFATDGIFLVTGHPAHTSGMRVIKFFTKDVSFIVDSTV